MPKHPNERQEPIYLVEKANKREEFTRKATRINTLRSIP